MKDIVCPFCSEQMKLVEGNVVILPMFDDGKVSSGKDGSFYSKLHPAVGKLGSYLPGICCNYFKCDVCGFIVIFEKSKNEIG